MIPAPGSRVIGDGDVDTVAAFERFELRRDLTKTGVINPVEPCRAVE